MFTEAATVGNDADIVRQALALPFVHEPGTWFEYGQRRVDLLVHVVERALGRDIQEFAQAELFGPIGIERHRWSWVRDRTGHTYGNCSVLACHGQDVWRGPRENVASVTRTGTGVATDPDTATGADVLPPVRS